MEDGRANGPRSGVSQAPNSLLGQTIDERYRVDALLGEGGMGLVYRVTHTRLNKPLAIKVLRRENTGDEEVLARFRREAESASAIGNQHIVDINDFGMLADGSTYFVMECLEGMDLIEAMDIAPRMPEDRALHIAIQICRALGAAHDAGIVHRDLKPENVFLTTREIPDFVKVLDFGIAKVANRPSRLTRQGEVLGTPHYMSPEQCEGENVDHRTDIYALGVLLYEMLTGHVPHDADTMMGILTKHMYEDPIPPRIRAPEVSEELQHVILRCLDKKPDRRYQTMRELEADLTRVQSGQRPSGPDTVTITPTRPPQSRRPPVSPIYLGGLGLALAALAVTLAMQAIEKRVDPAPAASLQAPTVGADPVEPPPASEPETAEIEKTAASEVAVAPETRKTKRKVSRTRPTQRRPENESKSPTRGGEVILDPWN